MSADGEYRSWLTRTVAEEHLVELAGIWLGRFEAGDEARLAVRQRLDQRIREIVRWPRQEDYAQVADDLDRAGRGQEASVLRQVATGQMLDQARDQWQGRYYYRVPTDRDISSDLPVGFYIDPRKDLPGCGIDGAWYTSGQTGYGSRRRPAVGVYGRGHSELIRFPDAGQQRRWLADRGPVAAGELIMPDVVPEPRVVQEEKILAGLLADPGTLAPCMAQLPPDTFTADHRFEIYGAVVSLAEHGPRWDPGQVAGALERRLAQLPGPALRIAGGDSGPCLHAYLQRLLQTPVSRADAEAAAGAVAAEDTRARQAEGWYHAIADPVTREPVTGGTGPDYDRWDRLRAADRRQAEPPLLPPPPSPHGPAPRL